MNKKQQAAFTIVELLIVIVVIGILAAITVVAFNGIQERARATQANSELSTLVRAIHLARVNESKVLKDITGTGCTRCSGTQDRYELSLNNIAAASGANLDGLKDGDPWGNMYWLDENEGEGTDPCSNKDALRVMPSQTGVTNIAIPFYQCPN